MMTGGSLIAPPVALLVVPLGSGVPAEMDSSISLDLENSLLVFLPTILLLEDGLPPVAVSLPVVAPSVDVDVFPDDDRGLSRSRRPGCRNLDSCRDGVNGVC